MPDHLHFLACPREDGASVLTFTDRYKGRVTNRSWTLGWQGKLWQPRYFDHIVRTDESLIAIAEYILNNPVRKHLVEQAEDWQWGSHANPLPIWP
jgi:putative transposase